VNVLGIETSCDETSVAVVADGRRLLSNVVASQMLEHARYGGIVPEVASRRHVEQITIVLEQALRDAELTLADIDAIAVTNRPGLLGALLVGVTAAKALAMTLNVPLIGVHHIEAHLYANFLTDFADRPAPEFPAVALVVSGGHTDLFHLRAANDYTLIGRTRDDAAGEAFDKCARLMGLAYPGGPAIQQAALTGNPRAIHFPRAYMDGNFEFSFSGLKTSVRRLMQGASLPALSGLPPEHPTCGGQGGMPESTLHPPTTGTPSPPRPLRGERGPGGEGGTEAPPTFALPDIAASFQEAVVDVLVRKTLAAAAAYNAPRVFMAGGVAANARLRERMQAACDAAGLPLYYPPLALCTDNGAMIAATGYYQMQAGRIDDLRLTTHPSEPLATVAAR